MSVKGSGCSGTKGVVGLTERFLDDVDLEQKKKVRVQGAGSSKAGLSIVDTFSSPGKMKLKTK